ncbi:HORMA-1 domain-containing protein [Segeticoccus rhizosphaerae]|uniref:HORMA-1 domain-containing protein n=1 Tax=Segeticoccus rhizosphaerae TaxID=1104777 RepID=UPI0010BFC6D9|nr:hypothetical protein [Ornithinicoccus soli]
MTYSLTRTATFTITEARYIASKLGADLRNLNARYGRPRLDWIPNYVEETAQYLKSGYLNYVDFGFKDGGEWKLRLRYTAVAGGQLRDDVPGGLPSALDTAPYEFHSFLSHNSAFDALTDAERVSFKAALPIDRTPGTEPTAYAGSYGNTSQYSRGGHGLDRSLYSAI